ncbi:MAG: HAD-IA family hydrolase [Burkholderiales bacterium]|nr:HAD-IA family hydrolase [Burkholderiales bacterium]
MIRAITFDFWNTLFAGVNASHLRRRALRDALHQLERIDVADQRIEDAVAHAWQEWDRVWIEEQRTFGAADWVSLVLAELAVNLDKAGRELLAQAMASSGMQAEPPLVDGLLDVLPRLAQRFRLAVICDTGLSPGWMLRKQMEAHGIRSYFSHLTFSDELGVSKPHPRPFLTTLDQLGVSPSEAVHIGDYPRTDIAGAKAVGMRAVRFTGVYDWGNDPVAADAAISSYDQLEPLLDKWNR